jgi:hypothetical protein
MAEGRTISTWTPAEKRRFRALRRRVARKILAGLRARYEAGDRGALLSAIKECALTDMVMPPWLALAFLEGWRRMKRAEPGENDWNEIFGRPFPKYAHVEQRRERLLLESEICRRVAECKRMHKTVPWEELARELGSSKGALLRCYYGSAHYLGMKKLRQRLSQKSRKFWE